MIGDVQFHHAAANIGDLLVLRRDLHALRHRRGAGGGQPLHALDLHQAQAAGAEGFELSVAHSLGILTSASAAARITEVPSGTVTSRPSMVSVTVFALMRCGVPKIVFDDGLHGEVL